MTPSKEIPVIDFGPFLHGTLDEKGKVAKQVDHALRSVGFIYLRNHGISQQKVNTILNWSRKVFSLPDVVKLALPKSTPSASSGYSSVSSEQIRKQVCTKEGLGFGNPDCHSEREKWPTDRFLPGMNSDMQEFYKGCDALVKSLLDCLNLSLGLPDEESLRYQHVSSDFNLELIHYPEVLAEHLRSRTVSRAPAHSDFGTLTLLFQDNVGGLEVADMRTCSGMSSGEVEKTGTFIPVTPTDGTVVVNCGYLLMRWSNGRWKNTVHRVTAAPEYMHPQPSQPKRSLCDYTIAPQRFSIAFFSTPDMDAVVEALPGTFDEEKPKKWKSLHVGNYLARKRTAMYA